MFMLWEQSRENGIDILTSNRDYLITVAQNDGKITVEGWGPPHEDNGKRPFIAHFSVIDLPSDFVGLQRSQTIREVARLCESHAAVNR